jgi:thiamine-phosphate pyrophosphorylase
MNSRPRLYLITPPLGDTTASARDLGPALDAGDIAAVLLRLDPADERTLINRAKAIAAIVQRRDVALLVDGHPDVAIRAGADGAHLSGIEAFTGALGALKPDRIAGAGGLFSRDEALRAGEAGADYVMFGEPPPSPADRPAFAAIAERIKWWAELIEVPCVGYAANLDEAAALAQAGADFIALGEWIWTQDAAAMIRAAAGRLAAPFESESASKSE